MPDFASLSLSQSLLSVVAELGYERPTPIQVASLPPLLAGRDLVGQSKTGSGKTAAFALPILQSLDVETRILQALVVCPTRELCAQVARELRKLGRKHAGLAVVEIAGGQPIKPQVSALERGVHVVVGTPGRLLDHVQRGSMDTRALTTVVLDEADRMLDMGFQADMEAILASLPRPRQTVFFSATFPTSIEALSRQYQRDAVHVTIDEVHDELPEIWQAQLAVERDDKLPGLLWLLAQHAHASALIFCNFKATVAELQTRMRSMGLSVDSFHGDLEQYQRDQVLAKFRNGSIRNLIATDVAGRGIDVEDLELVVNYELPAQAEIYVHRIGRTGRAGKQGRAVSLVSSRDGARLKAIAALTGAPVPALDAPQWSSLELGQLAKAVAREASMATILISGGRKDKVRPGDILGALTGEAGGLRGTDIGKIEIHDRLSYVAVSRALGAKATQSLNLGRIKGKRFKATLV